MPLSLSNNTTRTLVLAAGLLIFGAAKFPVEQALTVEHRLAWFHKARLDLSLWEQIGQGAFLAALSGFRAPVADFLWISAEGAFERADWTRLMAIYNNVTALQPRQVLFWRGAGWTMAYDVAKAARLNPNQPREALRVRAERGYLDAARGYFERGIRNNPDSYELYGALGAMLRDRAHDHLAAYEAFKKAATLPNRFGNDARFAAYELAEVPGREKEAYAALMDCYRQEPKGKPPLPSLVKKIRALEEKLDIPLMQRIYVPMEKGASEKAQR